MLRRAAIPILLASATACVPASPPPPPAPAVAPPAPPPVLPTTSDWRDWPLTPGTWRYSRTAGGSEALFGTAGSNAAATLRCDFGGRRLYVSRSGADPAPLTIRTSSATRALPVIPAGTSGPLVATLAANDPLLDAMAFSRGRFVIEQVGTTPLVIPAYAEIGRVIEDCRG